MKTRCAAAASAYKIIGGVRFYERKEVKDALAYLKLILSPQDDVSLRRVINVPARGIGKGVMESLEAVEIPLDADTDADTPLLAGLQPTPVPATFALGQAAARGRAHGCSRHARSRRSQRSAI